MPAPIRMIFPSPVTARHSPFIAPWITILFSSKGEASIGVRRKTQITILRRVLLKIMIFVLSFSRPAIVWHLWNGPGFMTLVWLISPPKAIFYSTEKHDSWWLYCSPDIGSIDSSSLRKLATKACLTGSSKIATPYHSFNISFGVICLFSQSNSISLSSPIWTSLELSVFSLFIIR